MHILRRHACYIPRTHRLFVQTPAKEEVDTPPRFFSTLFSCSYLNLETAHQLLHTNKHTHERTYAHITQARGFYTST
jgi:hypothetical protein